MFLHRWVENSILTIYYFFQHWIFFFIYLFMKKQNRQRMNERYNEGACNRKTDGCCINYQQWAFMTISVLLCNSSTMHLSVSSFSICIVLLLSVHLSFHLSFLSAGCPVTPPCVPSCTPYTHTHTLCLIWVPRQGSSFEVSLQRLWIA